ncbi:MAG: Arylsulfatase [Rhodospirillales bacterium]|jgi:arylsulfatase A-like enzyme|nr:Arylsulfatase [Rhodospirillales bacterium]
MPAKRPNFIVIMTDQHRADYLGCYGHPFVRTPAIDGLAKRGTRFDRFYVSSPVCMPNRATFMTGRLPSINGARGNGIPLSLQANTFVDLLRNKGYRTALVGKSHLMTMGPAPALWKRDLPDGVEAPEGDFAEAVKPWAPEATYDQENAANWEKHANWKLTLPFYGFEKVHLCTGHGDQVGGEYVHWLRKKGVDPKTIVGPDNAKASDVTVPQAWRTSVPEELYPTRYIQDHASHVLDDWSASGKDQPFFMMLSFPDPHHPFTPPGRYWDMYKPEQVTLPKSFYAAPSNADAPLQQVRREQETAGFNHQNTMVFLPVSERHAKEAAALTCGMITMIDDAVAAIVAKLKALDLDEDTIIVFTADHGDFLGDHGLALKGPLHLNSIVNVPFIWSDPQNKGVDSCDALAGTIDISSTILARAGLAGFNGMQGRSLLPEIADGINHGRGIHIVEEESQRALGAMPAPVRVRSLITDDWRLTVYHAEGYNEMYDLQNDPDEIVNLWDDPKHAEIRADLLVKMVRESIRTVDVSPAPRRRA